jgi:hypothetical protein
MHLMNDGKAIPLSVESNPSLKTVDCTIVRARSLRFPKRLVKRKKKIRVQLLQGHEEKQSRRTGLSVK